MCENAIRWKVIRRFNAIPPQRHAFSCWEHLPHVAQWMLSLPLGEPFVEIAKGDYAVKEGVVCQVDQWAQSQERGS